MGIHILSTLWSMLESLPFIIWRGKGRAGAAQTEHVQHLHVHVYVHMHICTFTYAHICMHVYT